MTVRTCQCGAPIPPQIGPGAPRKHCAKCAPPRNRGRLALVGPSTEQPASTLGKGSAPAPIPDVGPMFAATLLELRAVGRHETPEGLLLLRLAQAIDAGGGTAAGLASVAREFHASKAKAFDGAGKVADVIDGMFGAG